MKILSIVRSFVDKQQVYGYLQEIVVKRANKKEYILKEAEFLSLYLNDIEDMFLLYYQNKLHHLDGKTQTDLVGYDYEIRAGKSCQIREDEVCKFGDATLVSVRDELKNRYVHARLGIQDHAIVGFMAARYMNETGRAEADGDEQSDSEKMKVFSMVAATSSRRVRFIATCSYSSNKLFKLKNIKKDDNKSFQDEERYEHVGPKVTSSQEGERLQDDEEIMFD
ncbi:hypothetical protein Tco_0368640 [Tanacetum coccineum]